jgi:hypothetical protein
MENQKEKDLRQREEALEAKEEALRVKEGDLRLHEISLRKREKILKERERVSLEIGEQPIRPLSKEEQKLIEEALRVYKIPKEHLFHSRIDHETGEAVIVTNGGKKLRHRKGEKAKFTLTEVQITGKVPEEELIWFKKLGQRVPINLFGGKRKEV